MEIYRIFKRLFSRNFVFKNYWWICLGFVVLSISGVILFQINLQNQGTTITGIIAVALSLCYFAQQQKLAETKLFKELFTEFNNRYDAMNGRLSSIPAESPVNIQDRQTIIDYFNLCSEEYLFRKEGYIHDEVWTAWCRGMSEYFGKEPFFSIWKEEEKNGSYYGLTNAKICEGAGLPGNYFDAGKLSRRVVVESPQIRP